MGERAGERWPHHPSAGRLALGADEGGEDGEQGGSTMTELLRARRRASRFGGSPRRSRSPHAPRAVREAPTVPDPLDAELLRRRDGEPPGGRREHVRPSGGMSAAARPAGPWPHDEHCTRSSAESADGEHPLGASNGATTDRAASAALSVAGAEIGDDSPHGAAKATRDDGSHLRYLSSTASREAKQRRRRMAGGLLDQPDAVLDPIERLLRELTPKEMRPTPNESSSRLRYRLTAAEALLHRCQDQLKQEIARRAQRLSNEAMGEISSRLSEGLSLTDINDLRALSRAEQPQPVVRLLGRCVCVCACVRACVRASERASEYRC